MCRKLDEERGDGVADVFFLLISKIIIEIS